MAAAAGAMVESPVLVVVGGWEEGTVEAYDPKDQSWSPLIHLPTRRAFHASAVLLNTLYVAGGQDEKKKDMQSFMRYYPHPTKPKWIQCPPMLTPRFIFGLAAFNRKLVAVGGLTDQGEYNVVEEKPLAGAEAYDPGANLWTTDFPPLPVPARGLATAMLKGCLYVVAGKLACRLQEGAKDWEVLSPPVMNTKHLALVALGDYLYAIGGIRRASAGSPCAVASVERYDSVADMWSSAAPLNVARHSIACTAFEGKIFACGGTDNNMKAVALVETYDPEIDQWEYAAPMGRPRGGATANVIEMQRAA